MVIIVICRDYNVMFKKKTRLCHRMTNTSACLIDFKY